MGVDANLICIIIHVSICIGGCKQKEARLSRGSGVCLSGFQRPPRFWQSAGHARWGFIAYLSKTWNASRSALVVHPFTYVRRTFRLILLLSEIFCGGELTFTVLHTIQYKLMKLVLSFHHLCMSHCEVQFGL